MPDNTVGSIDVPCSLFSGLNTELAPSDLPEGVSPDNQDVAFLPGSVLSRPCLHRLFTVPFSGNPTVTFAKTYTAPDGTIRNLYLTSAGKLYVENVTTSPGVYTLIGSVAAGTYAKSVSAFGREYIAFSDGRHGVEIPRQFDGTNFDRVSQDGPGAGPTSVQDLSSTLTIATIAAVGEKTIAAAPNGATQVGHVVKILTTAPHGLSVGQQVVVNGVPTAGYNGIQTVVSVPTTTTFTYVLTATGLGADGAGKVALASALCTTTGLHGLAAGNLVAVANSAATDTTVPYDSALGGNPAQWTVTQIVSPTSFRFSLAGMLSGASCPLNGANSSTVGGDLTIGGLLTPGVHQCVVLFRTRQGSLTAPSPPLSWTSIGGTRVQLNDIPIGPPNVIERVIAFTGAGGDNFFTITEPVQLPNPLVAGSTITIAATVVPDNTTTTAAFDFSDNALFGALAIDIPGNNLFAQVVLGPCLGVFAYASRLWWWGEVNKVQNFLNMGFEGGFYSGSPADPLGWTVAIPGGALGAGDFGQAWIVTGDGSGNPIGMITQSGYRDIVGISIIQPDTQYTFQFWQAASGSSGNVVAEFYDSGTATVLATATIPIAASAGRFVSAQFNFKTPVTIPAGLLLRVYAINQANLQTVTIDECEIVYTDNPYRDNVFRVSYVNNPEAFDGVTGVLGPESDPSQIRDAGVIRDNLYIHTADRLHTTSDTKSFEPSNWTVAQVANEVGVLSAFGSTSGEDFRMWATRSGLRIFDGGNPPKISQEIQSLWDRINFAAQHTIWTVNDSVARRCYIGVPLDEATAPNVILVLDYRELDAAGQISSSGPIHISFTGKMIASDLARKWTKWNLATNCGTLLSRGGNNTQFVLGAGNGQTPDGVTAGFGNVYSLDSTLYTDDDYGQVSPYYVSYFFVNHEAEVALGVGSHRKLYVYLAAFLTGIGNLTIIPLADSLANAWTGTPSYPMNLNQNHDFEWGLNVTAERVAFKFLPTPRLASTDVFMNLQKMIVTMRQDPNMPVRGAI